MAYNPNLYMPYGQQSFAQPNWAYQPTQATEQPINGLVSVTGIDGAKAYPLPPNSSMPLFDKDSDTLYVVTSDGAGFKTVKEFGFAPKEPQEQAQPVGYVSQEDFDALAARVAQLEPKPRTRKAASDGE